MRLHMSDFAAHISSKLPVTKGIRHAYTNYRVHKKRLTAGMEARQITDVSWSRTSQSNRLVIMVKDPTTLFAYWEVDTLHKQIICEHFHTDWSQLQLLLQVYDVTDILFDGGNAHSTQRMQVHHSADSWYITQLNPGRRYLADFGTLTGKGQFFPLLRSNVVGTPPMADKIKLEPSVKFAAIEQAGSELHNRVQITDEQAASEKRTRASVGLPSPLQREETWRKQFDGYHLAGQKGGDA